MAIRYAREVRADLRSVLDHLQRNGISNAADFIQELKHSCRSLESMPERFALVPGYESLGIRRRVHGNYLIFYRVQSNEIQIIRILHGARDFEAILFPDET